MEGGHIGVEPIRVGQGGNSSGRKKAGRIQLGWTHPVRLEIEKMQRYSIRLKVTRRDSYTVGDTEFRGGGRVIGDVMTEDK